MSMTDPIGDMLTRIRNANMNLTLRQFGLAADLLQRPSGYRQSA